MDPIILVELLLVGGGAIGFALWDLRSLERDRRRLRERRAAQAAEQDATQESADHDQ